MRGHKKIAQVLEQVFTDIARILLSNKTRNYEGRSRSVFLEKLSGNGANHIKNTHNFYCSSGNATSFFLLLDIFFYCYWISKSHRNLHNKVLIQLHSQYNKHIVMKNPIQTMTMVLYHDPLYMYVCIYTHTHTQWVMTALWSWP